MKKICCILFLVLLTTNLYGNTYGKYGKQYVYKAALRALYEVFKSIKRPVYYGNIYLVPDTDPVTKRMMYLEDMRENRKVFLFIIVYQF